MTRTQAERDRVIRSKERIVNPIPAAFAEKLEAELVAERAKWAKWAELEKTWNPMEVAQALGMEKDTPIRAQILGKVRELVRERDGLRRTLKFLVGYVP